MRILIAEDDATSRLLLEKTLGQWGYEVTVTKDGDEAWDVLQSEEAPNLAVLDWMMPSTDGIDVCRRARDLEKLQHLYIIMLTTRDTKEDLAEALEAGADDYINKPFNLRPVIIVIADFLTVGAYGQQALQLSLALNRLF